MADDLDAAERVTWRNLPQEMDYYEVLQVSRSATPEVIRSAYRALIKRFHPDAKSDVDPIDAEHKTRLLNAAYETLSDPGQRVDYDRRLGIR